MLRGVICSIIKERTIVLQNSLLYIQINQPTRCISLSDLLPVVKYSSTCFGHPRAHHQELINFSSHLWFTVGNVVVAVLLVVVGAW
jgi:hypothetical protein